MSSPTTCYHFNSAIVRKPSSSVVSGLRAEDLGDPDYHGVKAEHDAYIKTLESVGMRVTVLPALEAFPDSIFMEDPALVFTEGAIILNPGAPSRQGEAREIAPVLHELFEKVLELPQGGHADGGDILVTPKSVMIGLSARTDEQGATALIECLKTLGHRGEIVNTPEGVLHFKTECSLLDEETVLVTRRMAQSGIFNDFRKVILPDGDEPAANAVRINKSVLVSSNYQRTMELLDQQGYSVVPMKTSEIQKIDAGLSCMSLRWFRS
ncbi:dimethylargininase [Desulfocicer vacuolatum DSM 3385]|uniref:Dimethylargininase n=1 Tax=Desulfocicer vacuolatum DSM 3385 TaxID=1121400 RepID=A0A1W2A1A1_9BACT|nr:arginine deiminase family protein [Desulfocicer vacuolatum]SMC54434.1 dimethylargininase [Desulfocicer vacuolatum DSM 3385]